MLIEPLENNIAQGRNTVKKSPQNMKDETENVYIHMIKLQEKSKTILVPCVMIKLQEEPDHLGTV